jgi:Fic family protein
MRLLGTLEGINASLPQPLLRRTNQIRSIQGSLAIEGNTLSIEQVTAVLNGQRVMGPRQDVQEVLQAIKVYESVAKFKPYSEKHFLHAHAQLMNGLIEKAGQYRASGVGIMKGTQVVHMAPPARRVPILMRQLFAWAKATGDLHPVVLSSVFHYELEFIHPFGDGNGRMGRFWQHVILVAFHPVFEHVPFESVIAARQAEYYRVLEIADSVGECTAFVEFCAEAIHAALQEYCDMLRPAKIIVEDRLTQAQQHFGKKDFSRKDYLKLFKRLSTATASRDLQNGVEAKMLVMQGTQRLARYRFG